MRTLRTLVVAAVATFALAAPGSALAADQVPYRASDSGFFVAHPTSDPAVIFTEDFAAGHATHLGAYTLEASEFVNLATLEITGGSYTLTGANGDTIFGTYAGSGSLDGAGQLGWHVSGPVTGGTGRFAGVSGTLVWDGTGDLATGRFTEQVSGTMSSPGAAKPH